MENFLSSNEVFTIDLTASKTSADVVFEISQYLDNTKAFGKNIYLKLADIDLSQAQLLSLKSLINSINANLMYLESQSSITIASAQAIGIETPNNPNSEENNASIETAQETVDQTDFLDNSNLTQAEIEAKKYINMEMLNSNNQDFKVDTPNVEPDITENQDEQQSLFDDNQNYNSSEQELDDFAPRSYENEENVYKEEVILDDNQISDFENPDQQKFTFTENNYQEDENQENFENNNDNVLNNIEQSVEFEELANNANAQSEEVQDALEDIFDTEKKLESILEDKHEEQLVVDLTEPLDNTFTEDDAKIAEMNVKYIKQTIRSGNVITSDGNLVIIGDCHPGSEIHAAGDVTVWGILGGIVHAGNKGNKRAKVRALKLNPIQLRIANLYSRRPDALHTITVEKTSTFIPEEARILSDEIIIYTMNEK